MSNSTNKDYFEEDVLEEQSLEKEDNSKQKPPFKEQTKSGPFYKINPDGLILPDWSLRKGSPLTTTKINSNTRKKFIEMIIVDTPIATDIRITDIDARYDSQAKILFSHRVYLAWLLKENVEVYRCYSIEQIANEFIEPVQIGIVPVDQNERFQGESLRSEPGPRIIGLSNEDSSFVEGVVCFDILFRVLDPTRPGDYFIVNLEIQNNARPGYDLNKRIATYNSRLISLQKNREYTHSDYNNLKRVLSFWLILHPGKADENIVEEHTIISTVKRPGTGAIETRGTIDSVRTWKLYIGNPDAPDCPKIIRLTGTLVSETYSISQKNKFLRKNFTF